MRQAFLINQSINQWNWSKAIWYAHEDNVEHQIHCLCIRLSYSFRSNKSHLKPHRQRVFHKKWNKIFPSTKNSRGLNFHTSTHPSLDHETRHKHLLFHAFDNFFVFHDKLKCRKQVTRVCHVTVDEVIPHVKELLIDDFLLLADDEAQLALQWQLGRVKPF